MASNTKSLKQILAEKAIEKMIAQKIAEGKVWDSGKKFDPQTAMTESKWSTK